MWKAILIAGFPVVGFAQGYGDTPLTQSFENVWLDSAFNDNRSFFTTYVEPVAGGGYVEFECTDNETDECWTIHYSDFGNALAWGDASPTTPIADVLAALTPLQTRDRQGGAVFPLRDGAQFTWVEIWRSDELDADYDMRLSVSCCENALDNVLDVSDRLWTLTFSYENSGDVGVAHGGEIKFHYDAAQNVIVDRTANNWWEDEGNRSISFAVLTGFMVR